MARGLKTRGISAPLTPKAHSRPGVGFLLRAVP
jgi:hypothetical protein